MKRILHLGLGAFHRAHQAAYMQALMDAGDTSWEIAAGNICEGPRDVEKALLSQGGVYTLETVTPDGQLRYQPIFSIKTVVPYEPSLKRLINIGADEATRIISFTVTEAGYEPGAALYVTLARILAERRAQASGPLTLLNCDNLRHNGDRVRAGLLQHLADDEDLRAWVIAHTTCPNAMVDRITPRPPLGLRERVLAATGLADAAPLMAESFQQWVIEENFCAGRPAWERVGVEMVDSVDAHEEAKIRILNASHSCIAWAGALLGYRFIHEAVADARVRTLAFNYVTDDVQPCLQPSPLDLAAYRDTVLARFGNAALADTCERVVADGFAKLPGFIAPTIRERLSRNEGIASVAMLPALFLAFLQRWHAGEMDIPYQDQAMDPQVAHAICASVDPVRAFGADRSLWNELAGDARLLAALRLAAARIDTLLTPPSAPQARPNAGSSPGRPQLPRQLRAPL